MRLMLIFAPWALALAQTGNVPVIENDFVRVLSVTDQPSTQPGPMHEHKGNRVMVYLDSGDLTVRWSNGKVENQHWKPGDVAWSPAGGIHTSQNVSARPLRIVEIELKTAGHPNAATPPDRTRAIIDNPQVRVYQSEKAPVQRQYVAVDIRTAEVQWDKLPKGAGPFVIAEVK
ncbi:MAG: cupin domain-containing protein [Terriglobia bacterium]